MRDLLLRYLCCFFILMYCCAEAFPEVWVLRDCHFVILSVSSLFFPCLGSRLGQGCGLLSVEGGLCGWMMGWVFRVV